MNNRISIELVTLQNKESELGIKLPKPYFLFLENYGRSLGREMDEISGLFAKNTWFEFDMAQYDEEHCNKLKIEIGKNAMFGKEYDGCVLIRLTEQADENELVKMLEYIKGQNHRIVPVFSVGSCANAERIKNVIENYQFCRLVEGDAYTTEEQAQILKTELSTYGFQLKDEKEVRKIMEDITWEKEEQVEKTLKNVAKQMIYEKVMEDSMEDKTIECSLLTEALGKQEKKETIRVIGFVMGGR